MKVYEFYQDEKCLYIVSDHYTGGELFDKISNMSSFTEKWAASTMKQILSAINYCHLNKIVHRDLKPENILYESKQPGALLKVIDFGTSRLYDFKGQMHQRYGTVLCYVEIYSDLFIALLYCTRGFKAELHREM